MSNVICFHLVKLCEKNKDVFLSIYDVFISNSPKPKNGQHTFQFVRREFHKFVFVRDYRMPELEI